MAKSLTKIAVIHHPPTFKFEYTKGGSKKKYHKRINLVGIVSSPLLNDNAIDCSERITEVSQIIAGILIERHDELQDVPVAKIRRLLEKLLSVNLSHVSTDSIYVSKNQNRLDLSTTSDHSDRSRKLEPKKEIMTESKVLTTAREKLSRMGDLNRVTNEEYLLAKNEMNDVFETTRVVPGDVEYIYDKRVEFEEPDEECSWD